MDEPVTRRNFLRRFAALSSAAVLMRFTTGCGDHSQGGGMYGPGPVFSDIYYTDINGIKRIAEQSNNVPVNTKFDIAFTSTPIQNTLEVTFTTADGAAVPNSATWLDTGSLEVVPASLLNPNTNFSLLVEVKTGFIGEWPLISLARAQFTTASA